MSTSIKKQFASQILHEFQPELLINLHESISSHILNHERFINEVYKNPSIRSFARSQQQYFAIMEATNEALSNFEKKMYRLKETNPKGGLYPLIELPSFSIIPRRSNSLKALQKANYLKDKAIQNACFEQSILDLFDTLENPNILNSDRIFMILDVYISDSNQAHLTFRLPSTDLKHIHLNITYEEVLSAISDDNEDEPQPESAKPKLKKILQELDLQAK